MELKLTLDAVTTLVRDEREYQRVRWPGHTHSAQEYLVFIRDYIEEALHLVSRNDETEIAPVAMGIVRKVAAMCVASREERHDQLPYSAHTKVTEPRSIVAYLADLYKEAETGLLGHVGDRYPAIHAIQSMAMQAMQQHGAPMRAMPARCGGIPG